MTTTAIAALFVGAVLLLTGCSQDGSATGGDESADRQALTLTTSFDDRPATRANPDVQTSQFDTGETFYAYFPSGVSVGAASERCGTTFEVTGLNAQGRGVTHPSTQPYFNPNISSATIHAYYPSSVSNTTNTFSVALDQSQTVAGNAGYKASDLMYATATATVNKASASAATTHLTFSHKMAKIVANVTLGQGITAVTAVRIIGGSRTVAISTPLTCTLGAKQASGNLSSSTYISMFEGSADVPVTCAALFPPQTVSGDFIELRVITANGDPDGTTYTISGDVFESGYTYVYNMNVQMSKITVTTEITDWNDLESLTLSNYGGDGLTNYRPAVLEAVDLGLPSGTKWANINVGAETIDEKGDYFAWGEVAVKSCYNSTTYRFGSTTEELWKYNATDGKTELEDVDDVAQLQWGQNWRLPTYEQYQELVANTTKTPNTINSQSGYIWKSDINGNSIFLPIAGRWEGSTYNEGTSFYLTKSLVEGNYATYYIGTANAGTGNATRTIGYGYVARPVWKE